MKHSTIRVLRWVLLGLILIAAVPAKGQSPTTNPVTFYGRVLDEKGKPVSGAEVQLPGTGRFTSDSDGRFSVSGAGDRTQVWIKAGGFGTMPVILYETNPREPADIRLAPGADLRLRLLAPDGKPAAGVMVAIQAVDDLSGATFEIPALLADQHTQTSDANGAIQLTALQRGATVRLNVLDRRYSRFVSPTTSDGFLLADKALNDAGECRLEPAASIRGRVNSEQNSPFAEGIIVRARQIDNDTLNRQVSMTTDARGNYMLEQLAAGMWEVSLELHSPASRLFTAKPIDPVTVGPAQQVTGRDFALVQGRLIYGRVTVRESRPPAGTPITPVANVTVRLATPIGSPRVQTMATTISDAEGRYALRAMPGFAELRPSRDPVPGFSYPVPTVRLANVLPDKDVNINFQTPRNPNPDVTGRVVDAQGQPVPGAQVMFENPAGAGGAPGDTITDGLGRFRLANTPDLALLRARKGELATANPLPISSSRKMTLVLQQNVAGSLLVQVNDEKNAPVSGARIAITQLNSNNRRGGRGGAYLTTGRDGRGRVDALFPDSAYSVEVNARGYLRHDPAAVRVQPGKQSDLQIKLGRGTSSIGGMVIDAKGSPVPDAQVRVSGTRTAIQDTKTDVTGRFRFEGIFAEDTLSVRLVIGNLLAPGGTTERVPPGTDNVILTFPLEAPAELAQ